MKILAILLLLIIVAVVVLVIRSRNKHKARVVKPKVDEWRIGRSAYTGTVYEHREPIGRSTKAPVTKDVKTTKPDREETAAGYVSDYPEPEPVYYETPSYDYNPAPAPSYDQPSPSYEAPSAPSTPSYDPPSSPSTSYDPPSSSSDTTSY